MRAEDLGYGYSGWNLCQSIDFTLNRVVVHGRSFSGADGKDRTIRLFGGYDGPNIMAMPSGGNQPHNNMPPYYVLAYIMKL